MNRVYNVVINGVSLGTYCTPSVVQRAEYWSEAERWSKLSHPNVVCVVGLCRGVDASLSLLYEFAFYGDLHEYLLVHSPHSDIAVVDNAGR